MIDSAIWEDETEGLVEPRSLGSAQLRKFQGSFSQPIMANSRKQPLEVTKTIRQKSPEHQINSSGPPTDQVSCKLGKVPPFKIDFYKNSEPTLLQKVGQTFNSSSSN